ncbi:hypothetical protein F4780DRAFT_731434 [Xylariomycetidae sp. FL0641]|nr:hypothetical protein F4780DRAFT_731434 [Xylariomycetidae sp. FL0641]
MADNTSPLPTGDQGAKEERLAVSQPAGDVEMEDLSEAQPKPANPDTTTTAATTSETHDTDDKPIPVPDKDNEVPATSSSSKGKAPATSEDQELTIDPVDGPSDSNDLAVEVMLLLTTGARHPFRIDERYLTKRNVTVTGKTDDGKMDPFSITVYTLKELILRDWRKEWEEPPREPSSIRLIHLGKMLEDRNQLSRGLPSWGPLIPLEYLLTDLPRL